MCEYWTHICRGRAFGINMSYNVKFTTWAGGSLPVLLLFSQHSSPRCLLLHGSISGDDCVFIVAVDRQKPSDSAVIQSSR